MSTYFMGEFKLDKPPTAAQVLILKDFAEDRHDGKGSKCPGAWCQWVPNANGSAIIWDDGEKFYNYEHWIEYLIDNYLIPWGYKVNGAVTWDGDEAGDQGTIDVIDNIVDAYTNSERIKLLEEALDAVLKIVPDKLPLFMGINELLDKKLKTILAGD